MADFKIPAFLENQSVDDIHNRMMGNLPADIETSEGGHPWNLTMPPAYEKAYMAEFILPEAIKLIFPMFCEDYPEIMEYHAKMRNMTRKPAEHATGTLVIHGEIDTEIPIGSIFSTISINGQPSIDFETTETAVIGEDGSVAVPIRALFEGNDGNVAANTIVLNSSAIDTISTVTNPEPTSGGIEIESIESLQERVVEFDNTIEQSYGGSPSDYKRWALEVPGTGAAVVISPPNDTEPITIVLTDANGFPANELLCQAVWNHIMRPDNPEERKAPINDQLQVIPPSTVKMTVEAIVELAEGYSIEQAKALFIEALTKYMFEAADVGEVKISKVGSILSNVVAVSDYSELTVNGGTKNVPITDSQVPSIDESTVILTAGTV